MTKNELFSYLEKRLAVLDKNERADILAEFDQHISNKIAGGCTEEEAVADFGDPEQLVEEILEAYKLDPEYGCKGGYGNSENPVGRFLKNFGNAVNAVGDGIFSKSKSELCKICVKLAVLILVLCAVYIPVDMVINTLCNLFMPLGDGVYGFASAVIGVIFKMVYLLLVCYSVYLFIMKTFLADKDYKYFDPSDVEINCDKKYRQRKENDSVEREKCDSAEYRDAVFQDDGTSEMPSDRQVLSAIKAKGYKFRQSAGNAVQKANDDGKFVELLTVCLKVLVVLMMLPVLAYLLFNVAGLVFFAVLMCTGLPTIGITVMALGSLLCAGVFVLVVFRAVFGASRHHGNNDGSCAD